MIEGASEDVMQLLLSHGADINARAPHDGRTPIFHTLRSFSDDDFLLFVKHGADCTAQDSKGDTPLHVVLAENRPSILKVKTLLENGANTNAKNSLGDTPLHVMQSFVNEHVILDLLIARGADLEARTSSGLTVLMRILKGRNYNTLPNVKKLLALGARIDAVDFEGRTVLHILCQNEQSAGLLRPMVEAGADPKRCDFAGNTIFHEVAKQSPDYDANGQLKLLETILKLGVSPSTRNNAGQTPFYIGAGMRREGPFVPHRPPSVYHGGRSQF